jgi:RecJ-like exonuclease
VPNVQGNGRCLLTDRLDCPECHGSGRQVIGPLQMTCAFCHGLGYVGGDNEPAEDPGEPRRPMRPVWKEPAIRTLAVCHVCLGARTVVNLGGTGEPTGKLVELPCPACSGQNDEPAKGL